MNRFLIFSKKKTNNNFLVSQEDLHCFYDFKFKLTSNKGLHFFPLIFPRMKSLKINCFYAPKFINLRVSNSLIIKQLKIFLKGLLQGFFLEFRIIGLGFKIKKSAIFFQKLVKFDIGFSHSIKLAIPNHIKIARIKKRFMLFSNDYFSLKIVLKNIQNLRKHNPYKMRGLKLSGFKFRIKPGKKQNKR
jgi:hypothetical protein